MTDVLDPIERLASERPQLDPRDPLARPRVAERVAPTPIRPRRRRARRVAVVAAVACAAVLTGVLTSGRSSGEHGHVVGITTAEAREQAIDALRGVGRLRDYTSTSSWTATELDGKQRTSGGGYTYSRVDGASEYTRWMQADFAGIGRREGMLQRAVGTYRYQEVGNNRYLQHPWAVDARNGWHVGGGHHSSQFAPQPPPDFDRIIVQLEREQLIDARRDEAGRTIVEIERPAKELAPITSSIRSTDPVSMFAMGFVQSRDSDPDTIIEVRITIDRDGSLGGVRIAADGPSTHPDGTGGTQVESRIVHEQSWRPRTRPIEAPDPHDVIVVGNVAKARQGATGAWGPHGTLDTMSFARLRELRAAANRADIAARKPRRPGRSYPGYFARRQAEMRAFKAAVAEIYPFDRTAFAADEDCRPLWPDTGRAMDRTRADADPEHAGWQCDLGSDIGTIVVMPEPRGLTEWRQASGGSSGFGGGGYRPN